MIFDTNGYDGAVASRQEGEMLEWHHVSYIRITQTANNYKYIKNELRRKEGTLKWNSPDTMDRQPSDSQEKKQVDQHSIGKERGEGR
jgi:hypothetical protein